MIEGILIFALGIYLGWKICAGSLSQRQKLDCFNDYHFFFGDNIKCNCGVATNPKFKSGGSSNQSKGGKK